MKKIVFELEEDLTYGSSLLTEMKEKINTFEHDANCKQQAKRQVLYYCHNYYIYQYNHLEFFMMDFLYFLGHTIIKIEGKSFLLLCR